MDACMEDEEEMLKGMIEYDCPRLRGEFCPMCDLYERLAGDEADRDLETDEESPGNERGDYEKRSIRGPTGR